MVSSGVVFVSSPSKVSVGGYPWGTPPCRCPALAAGAQGMLRGLNLLCAAEGTSRGHQGQPLGGIAAPIPGHEMLSPHHQPGSIARAAGTRCEHGPSLAGGIRLRASPKVSPGSGRRCRSFSCFLPAVGCSFGLLYRRSQMCFPRGEGAAADGKGMFSGPAGLLAFGSAIKLAAFGTGLWSGRCPGQ